MHEPATTAHDECMRLRLLRMITLVCTALVVGLSFAHVMELPQKMDYGYAEYERVQHSMYPYYAYIGGPLEMLAIVSAIVLTVLVRRNRPMFAWTLTGTVLLAAGLAEWALVVQNANGKMAGWALSHTPAGWTGVRDQWEYGHVGHFALLGLGFVILLWSSLRWNGDPIK